MKKTEMNILETLWKNGQPMTASEIVRQNPEMKDATVRIALKSMLDENLLRVDGITKTTKNFARTFLPTISREQLILKEISKVSDMDSFRFASTLLEEESLSNNQLCKLRSIIDKRLKK